MLNNDLSNNAAPLICFSFERVICEKFDKKLFGYKYKVNFQNTNATNNLWVKGFRILYVTFLWPDKKLEELENELDDEGCLYSGVIKVKDNASLKVFCKRHEAFYYDTDKELVDSIYPYGQMWEGRLTQLWK